MFKIALWRVWFELLNLLKCLGYRGSRVFYLGYGANWDETVLERRRIGAHSKRVERVAGYKLAFTHSVPFVGMAFASAEEDPSGMLPGILLEISRIDMLRMDCFEAHAVLRSYLKRWITHEGRRLYFYVSSKPEPGLKPTRDYWMKIVTAYEQLLPDSKELAALREIEPIPRMVPKHPPHFMFRSYDYFGKWGSSALKAYDEQCVRMFLFFIFRPSIFQRWLPR